MICLNLILITSYSTFEFYFILAKGTGGVVKEYGTGGGQVLFETGGGFGALH